MHYRIIIFFVGLLACTGVSCFAFPAIALTITERVAGKILLQVESHGEGWYVHPKELARYYLGTPDNAFAIMRATSLGITDQDLSKIAIAGSDVVGDRVFAQRLSGRILLQVQSHGEAWYVYPNTLTRYYLGRPADAFGLMRSLGLGITTSDLLNIPVSTYSSPVTVSPSTPTPTPIPSPTPAPSDVYADQRAIILANLNAVRGSRGLVGLRLSSTLSQVAQAHADDMAAKGYFDLTTPSGTTMSDRVASAGYEYREIGIWLDTVPEGASAVITQWGTQDATNFSQVALGAGFREMGVGVASVRGRPTYILIVAIASAEYFAERTAALNDLTAVRNAVLAQVNSERQAQGLPSLVLQDRLSAAAQAHTDDMLAQAYFSHTSLDGRSAADRIAATGYEWRLVGENIAKGQFSVKEVMEGWMASPGHRENILKPGFTELGVGLSMGRNKDGYETVWAQEFGTPFSRR